MSKKVQISPIQIQVTTGPNGVPRGAKGKFCFVPSGDNPGPHFFDADGFGFTLELLPNSLSHRLKVLFSTSIVKVREILEEDGWREVGTLEELERLKVLG